MELERKVQSEVFDFCSTFPHCTELQINMGYLPFMDALKLQAILWPYPHVP